MQEVDINTLVNENHILNENIPNNMIIIGEIYYINIIHKYDQLDLSKVKCNKIYYKNQDKNSIKNHILPNSLEKLNCYSNQLTSLPELPTSLKYLYCSDNKLTSLPDLPNSLETLYCANNQITSLPDFTYIDHNIKLRFNQNLPISYIPYNSYLKFTKFYINKMNVEGYQHNPITNQEELDKYMDYRLYKMNRIKSGKK